MQMFAQKVFYGYLYVRAFLRLEPLSEHMVIYMYPSWHILNIYILYNLHKREYCVIFKNNTIQIH